MPTLRGFARGDFDTAFPLDDRFQELSVLLPRGLYLQAVGAYWLVIASAWREASRKPANRIVVGAPERVLAALVQVGLLGDDRLLCESSFERWVGAAIGRRRKDAGRDRTGGNPMESDGIQTTPMESTLARAPLRTDRPRQVVSGQDRTTPRAKVHAWLSEHGASVPDGWANKSLNEMVKVYGADAITSLWASAPADVRTSRQFVQYAERSLSPGINAPKPKGLGPSTTEVDHAFGD